MDDLLALLDEPDEIMEDNTFSSQPERPNPQRRRDDKQDASPSQTQLLALTVDDRIGIRMLNRKMSGLELMNLITDHPYHSPAQLSAYSLANLNKLLTDPAAVLDAATVCGKTELVTAGLVFSNSGTRLASSGNAYCVLTIGNLTTGPTVSVLLFGSSYGKHCRSCHPGKVVALINPRLIPSKAGRNDSTAVTFAVNEEDQLIVVADARDYGCCKAMTRAKNENGQWVDNGKQCKNFVDNRVSDYCQVHRKQVRPKHAQARGETTLLHQLRLQATAFPTAQGGKMRVLAGKQNMNIPAGTLGRDLMAQATSRASNHIMHSKLARTVFLNPHGQTITVKDRGFAGAPQQQFADRNLMNNALLNPQVNNTQIQSQAATNLLRPSNGNRQPLGKANVNPYANRSKNTQVACVTKTKVTPFPSAPPPKNQVVTCDILQKPKRRNEINKCRAINTDTHGFNGSVQVPAPSKIFATQQKPAGFCSNKATARVVKHERSAAELLLQQHLVAAQLREQKMLTESVLRTDSRGGVPTTAKKQKRDEVSNISSLRDELFGSINDIDRDQVVTAQSRFAHEADAEEYARSRRVVSELEQEESKNDTKELRNIAASQSQGSTLIEKEWRCLTCKKSFQQKPFACIRLNHRLRVERNIRAEHSIAEKRLALIEKKAEDGGLVLGGGLEWSRWNRFN